jgi:hypothetical protein
MANPLRPITGELGTALNSVDLSSCLSVVIAKFILLPAAAPLGAGAKKSPGLPGDTYVDFRSISIRFQQKHSRLLAKEVIKTKPVCICDSHVSKLMIPSKEKNYCRIFFH